MRMLLRTVRLEGAALECVRAFNRGHDALMATPGDDDLYDALHADFWGSIHALTGTDPNEGSWSVDDRYLEAHGIAFLNCAACAEDHDLAVEPHIRERGGAELSVVVH